jgi:hypothetical protein
MKWTILASLLISLAACAVRDPRCDTALRPIGKANANMLANPAATLSP